MQRINTFTVFTSFDITANHTENLRSLTFFLLNFSLSNRDSHFWFSKTLHWWSSSSRIRSSSSLTSCPICSSALSIPCLSLECIINFLHQLLVAFNVCDQIEFNDWICWDIWCFILKATMHEDILEIWSPNSVPESLDGIKFLPLWSLCFINFH